MLQNRAYESLAKYLTQLGFLDNKAIPAIALLYLDFADQPGKGKEDLVSKARIFCNKVFLPVSKKDALKEARKFISDLHLEESEYGELALQILTSEKSFRFEPFSTYYLCETVYRLLDIKPDDVVFDFGSGYGNFLVYAAEETKKNLIRPAFIGQEINPDASDISMMALDMCGANYQIMNVDGINFQTPPYTKAYVFPPFGMRMSSLPSILLESSGEKMMKAKTSSEWLFILKALEGMDKKGKLVAFLPEGALFKAQDVEIRKYIIQSGSLEAVISLPNGVLPTTSLKTDLVIFSHGNKDFKLVNGEQVLNGLPEKGLSSHEAAVDIVNALNDPNVTICTKDDVSTRDYVLTYSTLTAKNIYEGMENLVQLTDVVDVLRGSPKTMANFRDQISHQKTHYRILTSSNIENGLIDYDSLVSIGDGKPYERFALHKGDVVLTSKSTKVKAAFVSADPEEMIIVTGGMIILRPKSDRINGAFLQMFFESNRGKAILASVQKGIVITTISFEDLKRIKIPCPPLQKQEAMAKKYHSMLMVYDSLKRELMAMEEKIGSFYDDQTHEE